MMKKWLKNQKGLTLLELLAVIVVLGIIAAIAIPAINGTLSTQKDNADEASEQLIEDAALRYLWDVYPDGFETVTGGHLEVEAGTNYTHKLDVTDLVAAAYLNANFNTNLQGDTGSFDEVHVNWPTDGSGWTVVGVTTTTTASPTSTP